MHGLLALVLSLHSVTISAQAAPLVPRVVATLAEPRQVPVSPRLHASLQQAPTAQPTPAPPPPAKPKRKPLSKLWYPILAVGVIFLIVVIVH